MRIDKDNYYLNIAKAVAARSTCLRRQYGAVIVADDEIIATGYNGAPRGEANCCDVGKCYCREHSTPIDEHAARHGDQYGTCVAVHAEQNAIISAPRRSMRGATLYLACLDETIDPAPCNICDRMIKNAGITRVVRRKAMYEELRKAFIKRLTVDSPHHDARRKDFNQAIFDADEGFACFNGTDLDMVLEKFDAAVRDLTTYQKR